MASVLFWNVPGSVKSVCVCVCVISNFISDAIPQTYKESEKERKVKLECLPHDAQSAFDVIVAFTLMY